MLRFNENNEIIREDEYNAIIVGLQRGSDIDKVMDELEGLCEADGITVLGRVVQSLEKPNSATLIGKGKVTELAEMCENMEVDTVVFNDELSGVQMRNLEDALGVRIIDRTVLILDIFADRATSREGKLQVELAQLQYRMPRLTGFGKTLSRLGGGIGTRGPGEKKLETDRRHIASRIDDIKAELKKLEKNRQVQGAGRQKSGIPIVALMGYTNSGKSAMMNYMINKSVEGDESKTVNSQDMLFATLDTQHRRIEFEPGNEFLLIDTVGFVSGLPHSLVEAFKSTLQEVRDADLLVHVADSAADDCEFRVNVAKDVIKEVGAGSLPVIMAYNKCDIAKPDLTGTEGDCVLLVSAKTGENMELLLKKIEEMIFASRVRVKFVIPYDKGAITSELCENGKIESMEYEETGTVITGMFEKKDYSRYEKYGTIQDN